MTNVKKAICRDFEQEMWLFVTEELPAERRMFWREHLLNCNNCEIDLKEDLKVVSEIKKEISFDVDDLAFDRMINSAVSKRKSWIENILEGRFNYSENRSLYNKVALAGTIASVAIIISLLTHQSIPVKNIPIDLLDWEGKKITSQIDELKTRVQLINEDKWGKEIYLLDQRIDKLEKESDKFSFN